MTRDHDSRSRNPADMYAEHRCMCGHIVYADMNEGDRCRWNYTGDCDCTDHRTPGNRAALGAEAGAA